MKSVPVPVELFHYTSLVVPSILSVSIRYACET